MNTIKRLWLRASPTRGCVEAVLLMIAASTLVLVANRSAVAELGYGGVFVGPLCALWAAARIRIPSGTWQQQIGKESKSAFVLGVALSPILLVLALGTEWGSALSTITSLSLSLDEIVLVTALPFVLHAGAYAGARVALRAGRWWQRQRSRRFMWSLTHTILMAALLAVSPFVVLAAFILVTSNAGSAGSVLGVLVTTVPIVAFLAVLTVLGLIAVLPAALIIAFFSARRLTRRVEALAAATNQLRTGDYGARIVVDGHDEVAQLQRNFNAMAADLEQAIRDVQAERDAVTTLLDDRRQLIANVSHELRTPVATLRSYLDSTIDHWNGAPPASLRHDMEIMQRETVRLEALIDDLFTLARAEVSTLEFRPQPTDINALVQRCADAVKPQAWHSGKVEVLADVSPQHAQAVVDGARTEQIVYNLLHNAVRHTGPGGIVAAGVRVEPTAVVIEVRDTGEGIRPDDLPHVWERFYRAKDANGSGAGLGLALVKELAEAMGGSVAAHSVIGEGSCFSVRLPKVSTGLT